ncbi:MAG: PspC domain-containing protein [Candidatus Pacebacteria bacterium]|nr:PspC domain-containing protein [Candidatus Paceibacterota bacterium]
MKKTIPTSIANTLFYIEEDTYKELDEYLSSIRAHFASSPDSIEIIHDIEDRIREQFIEFTGGENRGENKSGNERIITAAHVAELIKRMGRPEDFGDDTESTSTAGNKTDSRHGKKFYRDTEHQVIAGVASGIGAYLNIDPVVVRILFLISVLLGGAGIIAYIILWIAVPEAKTASQKLEMQGDPVTLQSVSEKIKEKINTIDKDEIKDKAKNAGSAIGTIAERIARVFGGIIGVAFKIIAIIAILGISFAFFMAAFSQGAGLFDFPINSFLSAPMYYILLSIIFLVAIIPFIFLNSLGSVFLHKKTFFRGTAATVLFSIWMLAIFGGITFAATIGKNVSTYIQTDPKFQETTQTIPLAEFDKLIAQNAQNITIVSGAEYSATITGRQNDVDRVAFDPIDKTLRIHNKTEMNLCFFCYRFGTKITLTTPLPIGDIETQNASKVMYEGTFTNLDIEMQNASMIYLKGTADKLTATLQNASKLDAASLVTKDIELTLQNASKAEVNATESLKAEAMNASKIEQYGKADIDDVKTNNGSAVSTSHN